jgi:dTDP-4-amino-4,6-dideoxygalactose transaminase
MATTSGTKIPLVDLKSQYASIKKDIDAAIARVIENTAFIMGEEVKTFEHEFAEYTGFRHAVGVGNGTDALELALRGAGLRPGAEVIAPAHTFVATTEAATFAGGKVRLADVSDETFCMTADTLEAAASESAQFVLPVAIYGNPAGLDQVVESAARRKLRVVLDAAQAHGARLDGRKLGELVETACFSFYPGKNLGAYGDGGAVCTNDDEIARNVRMWRNHGREGKFDHEFEGVNSRLDGLQAAILRAKLPHMPRWTEGRRRVAEMYREALDGIPGLTLPREASGAEHVYHLFVVRLDDRDRVRKELAGQGISAGVHYPAPIHLLPAYSHLGLGRGSFPSAETICDRILSLPIYPELGKQEVVRVADALKRILA